MSEYQFILTETHDRVGLVRINRPKTMNAINRSTIRELMTALTAFDADEAIGAIVITGNDRAFAAGADIKEMIPADAVALLKEDPIAPYDLIFKIKKPVIAAVSGYCLGGGCELAMSCDMIIASETAHFGQPEITLGVIPGAGGTQRLTHAVGKALAMEMILNDRRLTAEEALHYGLVNRVLPVELYFSDAMTLAAQIASHAPVAVQLAKEAVNNAYQTSLKEGVADERRAFYYLFATEDQKEGMTAFVERRKPEWKGR